MTCKNCGARLGDDAKVCKNCGAFVDDNSGYVLLTSDNRVDDIYSSEQKEKKKHGVRNTIIFLLIIAILGAGSTYLYFTKLEKIIFKPPSVTFDGGSGYIDGADEVMFVTLDNSNIEYIHGVSLYDMLSSDSNPISTDYEYTKNIDGTFRTILFYTKDLNLDKKHNSYSFEIKLSFKDDKRVYTYNVPVEYSQGNGDAADTVFDHSMIN